MGCSGLRIPFVEVVTLQNVLALARAVGRSQDLLPDNRLKRASLLPPGFNAKKSPE